MWINKQAEQQMDQEEIEGHNTAEVDVLYSRLLDWFSSSPCRQRN